MSSGDRIPLKKATEIATRFLNLIRPYVTKAELAGSCRRLTKDVGDIEIVCVENPLNSLDNLFHKGYPGLVVDGKRLKRFKYPSGIQIELYIAQPYDYGRILAIRTGSSAFSHIKLAVTWNRKGMCGHHDGLRYKKDCEKKGSKWVYKKGINNNNCQKPPVFDTEYDFFNFLGIPWIPPQERNWTSNHDELNYSK
jgi:DNA polymerase/3'-5' exonuclease PolX